MSWHITQLTRFKGAFPNLYKIMIDGNPHGGLNWGIRKWGFECPVEWKDILWECSEKIEKEIMQIPEEDRGMYYAVQIKTKFNWLCFYMNRHAQLTDGMKEAISEAERKVSELNDRNASDTTDSSGSS